MALVEVDGGNSALADALGGELEFLQNVSKEREKRESEKLTA